MHGNRQWKSFIPLEASLFVVENFAVIGWKCKRYHEKVFNKLYYAETWLLWMVTMLNVFPKSRYRILFRNFVTLRGKKNPLRQRFKVTTVNVCSKANTRMVNFYETLKFYVFFIEYAIFVINKTLNWILHFLQYQKINFRILTIAISVIFN